MELQIQHKRDCRMALSLMHFERLRRQGGAHHKYNLCRDYLCFDIETTRVEDDSFCYHWQLLYGDLYIKGRDIQHYVYLQQLLDRKLEHRNLYIICFVHNLMFETHFLLRYMHITGLVANRPHRPIRYISGRVIYQCTYQLSHRSLASWADMLETEHRKCLGALDYSKYRDYKTSLTEEEERYCYYDVLVLQECVEKWLQINHYNLYNMAITKTGVLRKKVKAEAKNWHTISKNMNDDMELHICMTKAFRGGDTHASADFSGRILYNVVSYDRVSSYPAVMMTKKYPMSKFKESQDILSDIKRGYAALFEVEFTGLCLKPECVTPYISFSKCESCIRYTLDNGRVVMADSISMWITDVDLEVIQWYYTYNSMTVKKAYRSRYDYLPKSFQNLIMDAYRNKTSFKGVADKELDYALSKEDINSFYGLTAQSPILTDISVDIDGSWFVSANSIEDTLKALHRRATPYAWGVWTTAWSRYELNDLLRRNQDISIYWDTDSDKLLFEPRGLDEYNRIRIEDAKRHGAYAVDPQGVTHYMGVFESEGCYDRFKTLGAKRYALEQDGNLKITISGVPKKAGAKYLAENGGLEALADGYVFGKSVGHTASKYRMESRLFHVKHSHPIYSKCSVTIVETEVSVNLSEEYNALLKKGLERIIYEYTNSKIQES